MCFLGERDGLLCGGALAILRGDAARFSREYIPTIRTWNESIYFNGLSSDRPLEQRQALIEDYYESYRQQVEANPEGHGMDYVHAYMVIAKH